MFELCPIQMSVVVILSIGGTRTPVYVVLDHLAALDDYNAVLASFARLTRDSILACLQHVSYLTTGKALVA